MREKPGRLMRPIRSKEIKNICKVYFSNDVFGLESTNI